MIMIPAEFGAGFENSRGNRQICLDRDIKGPHKPDMLEKTCDYNFNPTEKELFRIWAPSYSHGMAIINTFQHTDIHQYTSNRVRLS